MRAVRFTKGEVEFLRERLEPLTTGQLVGTLSTRAKMVLRKLAAAEEAPKGVAPVPIEEALVATARGKVVPVAPSPAAYGRASRQATAVGATVEDARCIGEWMARQGWLHGPQTVLDVLNKWPQWLAKARATEPPPTAPPGFNPQGPGAGAGAKDGEPEGGAGPTGQAPQGRLRKGFGG